MGSRVWIASKPGVTVDISARQSILVAALGLFSTRGYEASTIEGLRAASGASTGSIYHHFKSKQDLAAALFVEGLAYYQEEVLAIYAANPDAEEGVRSIVRHYLRWTAENRSLARFLLTTREPEVRAASNPSLEELNRRFYAETEAWRCAKVERGALKAMPSGIFRTIVTGPAEAFARRWLAGRMDIPIEAAAGQLAEAAWRAVRPDGISP